MNPENRSAFHLYVIRLEGTTRTQREVGDSLRTKGIGVNLHYAAVHLQPYYRALGFAPGQFPEAEAYGRSALTLPLYPTLTETEQDCVVSAVTQSL